MDSSTPLKKSCLSSKQLEHAVSETSRYFNREANRTYAFEPEPTDSCARWADASTCVEVFPFPVSPICCAQNVTADLLDVPFLDSSNLKWSSTLHTSFAGDEADKVDEMETDLVDLIRSPASCHYYSVELAAATVAAETKTKAEENENDDGTAFGDGRFTTSSVSCSPIFATVGNRRRVVSGSDNHDDDPTRKNIVEPPPDELDALQQNPFESERDDAAELDALELDDSRWQTARSNRKALSKTSRYALNSTGEISRRFVYPLAGVCIRKPARQLNVDQLVSCALTLETRDGTRSDTSVRSSRSSVGRVAGDSGDMARARVRIDESAGASAMVAFSRLLDDDRGGDGSVVEEAGDEKTDACGDIRVDIGELYPKLNVTRALARIMFAGKNNNDDTVQARFVKLADQLELENAAAAAHRVRAGVARALYSTYYFASRVDLASYTSDRFYKRAFIRQLMNELHNSFKLQARYDYAASVFARIVHDIYVLEKTMAIPVTSLYVTRTKALRCVAGTSTSKRRIPQTQHQPSPKRERVDAIAAKRKLIDVYADEKLGQRIESGGGSASDRDCSRSAPIPQSRNADKITPGAGARTHFVKSVRLESNCRKISTAFAPITNFESAALKKCETDDAQLLAFKTCNGRTISVDGESLRSISERLFSDISTEGNGDGGDFGKMGMATATFGFKTSSGKAINVNDSSLRRSAHLFSDFTTETDQRSLNGDDGGIMAAVSGFKTGSGKAINVNDSSLRRSAHLFSDFTTESDQSSLNGDDGGIIAAVSGFKTGSGKAFNVNDSSLRRSAHLFSDFTTESDQRSLNGDDGGIMAAVSGFKTGSGKAINVNDSSLRRSAHLFSDFTTERDQSSLNGDDGGVMAAVSGFKTGSGKPINVDDNSLRMSACLFSNIATERDVSASCSGEAEITTPAAGAIPAFKTSSGKTINIDGSSLQMAARRFSDIPNEAQTGTTTSKCASSSAPAGAVVARVASAFKTGAGKVVSVGVESLERCDSLLADFDVSTSLLEYACPFETKPKAARVENEQQNRSFDLGREITEVTSAFLYDISREQSWCSSFSAPNESGTSANPNPNPKESAETPLVDSHRRESDASAYDSCREDKIVGSRSSSPVFDSKYGSSKRKCSTRKSYGRQSLDITYIRKTNAAAAADDTVASNDSIGGAELETSKTNFSHKTSKRKSSWADDWSAHFTVKKCKNDASACSQLPSLQIERLASSRSASRTAAVARQQTYISNKPKQACRPTRGYLSTSIYADGNGDRISLGRLARFETPKLYTHDEYVKLGLLPAVIHVNSQNARYFAFTSQFFSDQQLKNGATGETLFGDAVPVIFNEQSQVTLEEVTAGFLASPGVDPKLVSREWIANHYRWIVWKLASTERFFSKSLGGRYLTLDNVLFQLKFKYEQEVDRCVRSALKRILEGDDTPARPIVLCVASIAKEAHSSTANVNANAYKMELTDGWYSIFAQTDHQTDDLIARKKISVGTKLIIVGAELVGLREPCDPLQASENVRIKFSANSSRRVRWDTRLGFYDGSLGPVNRIQTILPKGGYISNLTAVVARVYPLLFLEKYDNAAAATASVSASAFADVSATSTASWSRLHNEKVEMKKAAAFERDRQSFIESILSQVTNQVLSENAKADADADAFADNERLREVIQQRIQSRLPVKFSKKRHVSRLLKLRLVDAQDVKHKSCAILTIWNPCDDVTDFFKEGKLYRFFNVNANCIRNGELQLGSTRTTKFDECCASASSSGGDKACRRWFERLVRSVDDFQERCDDDGKSCWFDEVDVTGVVIRIEAAESESPCGGYEQSCRIYLADLQQRFLALSFRIDSKNFDFGDSMENGKIVAGLNLQWKNGWLCWKIPILYVCELSSFVQSTNIASLRHSIDQIRCHFQSHSLETFVAECEEKLKNIVDTAAATAAATTSANENVNGDRSNNGGGDGGANDSAVAAEGEGIRQPVTAAVSAKSSTESDSSNKTGLVVGSRTTFKNSDVRSKFEKLQNYGRPPALSPIVLKSHSKIKAKLPLPVLRKSSK